jgi:hypothetical protein
MSPRLQTTETHHDFPPGQCCRLPALQPVTAMRSRVHRTPAGGIRHHPSGGHGAVETAVLPEVGSLG